MSLFKLRLLLQFHMKCIHCAIMQSNAISYAMCTNSLICISFAIKYSIKVIYLNKPLYHFSFSVPPGFFCFFSFPKVWAFLWKLQAFGFHLDLNYYYLVGFVPFLKNSWINSKLTRLLKNAGKRIKWFICFLPMLPKVFLYFC